MEPTENGRFVQVDLTDLAEAVYVSPTAPSWFPKLMEHVVTKYGLNKPVVQSSLNADPVY